MLNAKMIKDKALSCGFSACGIIPAAPFTEYRAAIDERSKLFPASAKEFYEPLYELVDPPADARSIIVCIEPANQYKIPPVAGKYIGKMYIFDTRMPYSGGYRNNEEFSAFLKNGGLRLIDGAVPDRWAAAKAGVGKFGRNNFTYTEANGSYLVVHTYLVDAVLEYEPAPKNTTADNCPEKCLACVRACPSKAMTGAFEMDRHRCVAQMTFNPRSFPADDPETWEQMGTWMYGCDVCQDVCPMNKAKLTEEEDFPLSDQFEELLKPENVLEMSEETYKNILNQRYFYIGEDDLWLWKCNALRVMINEGDKKYFPLIKKYQDSDDTRLRAIACWGCEKLGL